VCSHTFIAESNVNAFAKLGDAYVSSLEIVPMVRICLGCVPVQ